MFLVPGHTTLASFTKARLTRMQEHLKGNFEIRKTFEMALVSLTDVRLTSVQENRGGRPDTARPTVDALGFILYSKSYDIN